MQPTEPKAIEVTDLTVAYQDKPVLWDIDLDVPPGGAFSYRRSKRCRQDDIDQGNFRVGAAGSRQCFNLRQTL